MAVQAIYAGRYAAAYRRGRFARRRKNLAPDRAGVEAEALWGKGTGVWVQDVWNIHEGIFASSASAASLGCGRE